MKRWAGIARFGGIGDNLVAASPLYILKKLGYMTEIITSEPNHVVYLNNPHIDKLSVHVPELDFPQNDMLSWQKYFAGRGRSFDVFGHFSHSMEGRHAKFEQMTDFWQPLEYRRKICAGSYLETAHDIMGVPYVFDRLYYPTDEEIDRAMKTKAEVGGRFVSWILNGSRIDKVYPYCAFIITRLIKELDLTVVIQGGGEKDYSMAQAIGDHCQLQNSSVKKLELAVSRPGTETGGEKNWPLRRSMALAHVADLVVGPDTGLSWSVAFEPMPKVIMVSHTSVENITKHWRNTVTLHADPERVPCWPCHRLHNTKDTCVENKEKNGAACISDISVETIFETIKAKLNSDPTNVVPFKYAAPAQ